MLSLSRTTNPLCRRFLRQARGQISVFSQENQLSEVSDHPAALFADRRAVSFFPPSVTRPPPARLRPAIRNRGAAPERAPGRDRRRQSHQVRMVGSRCRIGAWDCMIKNKHSTAAQTHPRPPRAPDPSLPQHRRLSPPSLLLLSSSPPPPAPCFAGIVALPTSGIDLPSIHGMNLSRHLSTSPHRAFGRAGQA